MAEADPQKTFNVHDAKTHLSKLIERALAGEEIIIARAGEPMVQLVPVSSSVSRQGPRRRPGRLAHLRDTIPSDIWFEPTFTDEELDRFEGKFEDD